MIPRRPPPGAGRRRALGGHPPETGLTYTFSSPGRREVEQRDPLTAEDFVFSARRILFAAFVGEFSSMFFRRARRGGLSASAARKIFFHGRDPPRLDAHTAALRLPAPRAVFPDARRRHWRGIRCMRRRSEIGRIDQPSRRGTRPGNFVGKRSCSPSPTGPGRGERARSRRRIRTTGMPPRRRLAEIHFHFIGSPRHGRSAAFRSGQLPTTQKPCRRNQNSNRATSPKRNTPLPHHPALRPDLSTSRPRARPSIVRR